MKIKHHDHVTKENIRKAADYIHKTKKQGYSDHAVKNKLIEHDYDHETVKHGFEVVKKHGHKGIFLRIVLAICIIVAIYALLKAFKIL